MTGKDRGFSYGQRFSEPVRLTSISASIYIYYNKATTAGAFVQPSHFEKAKQIEIKLKLYTIHLK